jgi:alpha-tubulin suppressor-like RCC1 family protein
MRRTIPGVLLLATLVLAACGDDPVGPAPATSLQIVGNATVQGEAGEWLGVEPAVRAVDAQGVPVAGVTVTFTASGDGFASPTPVVTGVDGVARTAWRLDPVPGTQTLRAQAAGLPPATFSATVTPGAPAAIVVTPDVLAFDAMGDSLRVRAQFHDRFGNPIPSDDVAFEWQSLDPQVAIVRPDGWVIAQRQGTAQIVARVGELTGSAAARVMLSYNQLTAVQDTETINAITFTRQLDVQVRDRHGNLIEDPEVTWATRNAAVATVGEFGLVRAEGVGETWIVVEGQELSDSVRLIVRQLARDVVVTLGAATLLIGETTSVSVAANDSAGVTIVNPELDWQITPATSAYIENGSTLVTIGPGMVHVTVVVPGSVGEAQVQVFFPDAVIARMSAGANHGMAIGGAERQVYAWGWNINGSVGDGTTTRTPIPFATGLTDAVQVSATGNTSWALLRDGRVFAWGQNSNGQLGLGFTEASITSPREVEGFHPVWIEAGVAHAAALMGDGTVWTTGLNTNGQLGDGTTDSRSHFAPVPGLTNVVQVVAREQFTLVLKDDGTVWGWGSDNYGKLGLGGATSLGRFESTPVQAINLSNIVRIAIGRDHGIALDADGRIWTWGYNQYGGLGDGTQGSTAHNSTPTLVDGPTNVVDIAGSDNSTVVTTSTGQVWAWGRNNYLQIGDASDVNVNQPVPTQISITDAVELSGGVWFHMMVRQDGTVWGFGRGEQGQVGHGVDEIRVWPPAAVTIPPLN